MVALLIIAFRKQHVAIVAIVAIVARHSVP